MTTQGSFIAFQNFAINISIDISINIISSVCIHLRRRQIFMIFDPYPPPPAVFFTTIRQQILPIFDTFPPKECRHLKWMVPKQA